MHKALVNGTKNHWWTWRVICGFSGKMPHCLKLMVWPAQCSKQKQPQIPTQIRGKLLTGLRYKFPKVGLRFWTKTEVPFRLPFSAIVSSGVFQSPLVRLNFWTSFWRHKLSIVRLCFNSPKTWVLLFFTSLSPVCWPGLAIFRRRFYYINVCNLP